MSRPAPVPMNPARGAFPALLALSLAACGGGGGGGATTPPANITPDASFTATPGSGVAPQSVNFNGTASSDSDGSISSWAWDFGDGGTATGSTVAHNYTVAGNYTVTLVVTDNRGGTDATVRTVNIATNQPPVAVLNADRFEGFAPLTVNFDGLVSSDSDGSIASYLWAFGDGGPANLAAPTKIYNSAGVYNAQLTVTDNKGANNATSRTVYVANPADNFALAGAISLPETLYADCDTADTYNNPFPTPSGCNSGTAQALPSPATVGGFASAVNLSTPTRKFDIDASDDFALTLAGGEVITLVIADSSVANNLDLQLFDAGNALVGQSANTNTTRETINAPNSAGNYVVRVVASAGYSSYVLNIGIPTTTAATRDSDNDVIDGEFIAHFAQPRLIWRLDAQAEARADELDMDVTGGDPDAPMLLRERRNASALSPRLRAAATLRRLRLHPDVRWVEPNRRREVLALDATDTYYPLQWNLPLAHFPGAWSLDTARGNGAIVAVLDTGIVATHPDLAGNLVAGYDFVRDAASANDGDSGTDGDPTNDCDADPTDPGGDGVGRSTFHGTHVAGIIAAVTEFTGAGGNTGIAGAAPRAKIMPVRVVGRYGGTSYDVIQGILYAARLANSSSTLPAQRADVINLSIGSTGYSQAEQDAINQARAAGVIVVAAGGNTGTETLLYPAAYAGVTGVGAVTLDRRRASYSSTGTHIDIAAPGGENATDLDGNGYPDGVLGTLVNDGTGVDVAGYDFYQGSSMAAPHVSAVAAMMRALDPALTPAAFDALLAGGALTRDLGAGGRDNESGMGLLDAEKALVATGLVSASPTLAVASPRQLAFGATSTQALVVVDNGGGGTLTVIAANDDQPWLSVVAQSVDGNGLGSYAVTVSRGALANGNYSGTISFTTSAGTLQVPVSLVVDSAIQPAAAGTLYLVVWDPKQQDLVDFAGSTSLAPGTSTFSITAVADKYATRGGYQVYIGSDNDNDGLICDAGEACGAWPTLNDPRLFPHVRDRTDLSFVVGFSHTLDTLSATPPASGYTLPARGLPYR